jgi:predicted dehydrogenase
MLSGARLDGVLAITRPDATKEVATAVMKAGLPVYMEKPPGRDLGEALAMAKVSRSTGAPTMVACNRRFNPSILATKKLMEELGPATAFTVLQLRAEKGGGRFVTGTGIHAIDAVLSLGGRVARVLSVVRKKESERGFTWLSTLEFKTGALCSLLLKPTSGARVERFVVSGDTYTIHATGSTDWLTDYPGSVELHHDGKVTKVKLPPNHDGVPAKLYWGGFYGEVAEFVEAIRKGRAPAPSVAEVAHSVKVCERIQTGRSGRVQ